MNPKSVILIDDDAHRRQKLGEKIKLDPYFKLVAEISRGMRLPAPARESAPDIVIVANEIADGWSRLSGQHPSHGDGDVDRQMLDSIWAITANPNTHIFKIDHKTNPSILAETIKARLNSAVSSQMVARKMQPGLCRRTSQFSLIAIGASTGGVDALASVLQAFPKDCPPTLIVQHMKPKFVSGFTGRLNKNCIATVTAATDGALLRSGQVLVAPGGKHLEIIRGSDGLCCKLSDDRENRGHIPSVDVLFQSLANLRGPTIGVLLTGMGVDGAKGLLKIRNSGGHTIVQDKKSAVVYGMPRVAMEIGAADQQLPLHRIGEEILRKNSQMICLPETDGARP